MDGKRMISRNMEIKDQRSRSFIKIIGIELDHLKDQDHLGDLGSCRSKIMIFTQLCLVHLFLLLGKISHSVCQTISQYDQSASTTYGLGTERHVLSGLYCTGYQYQMQTRLGGGSKFKKLSGRHISMHPWPRSPGSRRGPRSVAALPWASASWGRPEK